MTTVYPDGTLTLGATSVQAVVTVATQTAAKLATEINAVTSVNLSGYLYPDGWAPTGETAKGARKPRLASKRTAEVFNRTTYSIPGIRYVHDPQAADSAPGNEARELLQEGTRIHLLERMGPDAETDDWAVGDRYRDHYVELGPQIEMGDPADDNGEFYVMQAVIYVNGNGPVIGTVVT